MKADGTVWAWGENASGEIGDGTTTTRRAPLQVAGLTSVVAVAAGYGTSYALKTDGTVWAWGANALGQLGDNSTTQRLSPVQVAGLSDVRAIDASESSAYALVTRGGATGAVWAWGGNAYGQLADGTTTNRLAPQPVLGASSVRALYAGYRWAAARTGGGELLLWGANDLGQMATGTQGATSQLRPVRTAPWIGPTAELGGGVSHVFVIDTSARLWGWGNNIENQLAFDPPSTTRMTAELVTAFAQAMFAKGGTYHSLAVGLNGQVWAWGANPDGQFGTGTTTSSTAPVQLPGFQLADNSWLTSDPDGDGVITWREYQLGLDPLSADTDGDGIPDGIDPPVGENAASIDPDGDGLSTAVELAIGTDPFNPDSDGDGVNDGVDAYPLDPTRSQLPAADPNDHTPPVITLTYPAGARRVGGQ